MKAAAKGIKTIFQPIYLINKGWEKKLLKKETKISLHQDIFHAEISRGRPRALQKRLCDTLFMFIHAYKFEFFKCPPWRMYVCCTTRISDIMSYEESVLHISPIWDNCFDNSSQIPVFWKNTYIPSRSKGDICKCKQFV